MLPNRAFYPKRGNEERLENLYRDYIERGAFPFLLQLKEKWAIRQYLSSIYDSVVLKDIAERKKNIDVQTLSRIVSFFFDSIGSESSANRIAGALTSSGRKISPQRLEYYLAALTESFIFYKAGRYDIKGKNILKVNPKYYATDVALGQVVSKGGQGDDGHILENIVFLELQRRGYKVYVGKTDASEVDFVAFGELGEEYYQVAHTVRDGDGSLLKRELRPLLSIKDHNPKYLLTLDYGKAVSHNGIRQIYVLDWLLERD